MQFKGIGDSNIIKPLENVKKYGMIHIPEEAQRKPQIGIIIGLGEGVKAYDTKTFIPNQLKVGNIIIYGRSEAKRKLDTFRSPTFQDDENKYVAIGERAVIGVMSNGLNRDVVKDFNDNTLIDTYELKKVKTTDFRLFGDNILVSAEWRDSMSDIIDTPNTKKRRSSEGTVFKIRKDYICRSTGLKKKHILKKGDKVLLTPVAGAMMRFADGEYWWLGEEDILAKIEE